MQNNGGDSNFSFSNRSELVLSASLLGVLFVLLVPLPPVLLDMLLATNLGVSMLLLLITLGVKRPLDISVFPSLLLLLTLYRLSLNVATTRLILLGGDAGRIVSTFGDFVVGGNLVVGMVIFLILIVIQFIVITKGAGRVSEVAARFTLDALPGKQMAIDAELNAGVIDDKEARGRREGLTREAEFYGAMDGASKFVRGDAIAGLLVTGVNLLGGVVLGTSAGLSLAEAAARYSVLTIGDGLVSQIPALIVAVTSGMLVTKGGSNMSLGHEIGSQLTSNLRPLGAGAVLLCLVALAPGLPKLPFLLLAAVLGLTVRRLKRHAAAQDEEEADEQAPADEGAGETDLMDGFLQTERVCVEIGARLIPLVDNGPQIKGLADRISSLRKDLTRKHGLWIPAIRIRDNVQLDSDTYRILIGGREVARGQLRPDRQLAIATGQPAITLQGEHTKDPAFGLDATWIDLSEKPRAELAGFTVVDAASVLITHLGETLRAHPHELLSRDDLQLLLEKLHAAAPAVVEELKADSLRTAVIHQVLLLLLEERVPITDLGTILEAILNHSSRTKEPEELAEMAPALGRSICDRFRDPQGMVRVVVLEPRLEHRLQELLRDGHLLLQPQQLERLISSCHDPWQLSQQEGHELALLADATLRRPLRRTLWCALPELAVLAYPEIPRDVRIDPRTMIRGGDVWQEGAELQTPEATVAGS